MEDEKALAEERLGVHNSLRKTTKKLNHARRLLSQINERYSKEKIEFERLDRELAMIDGRFKRLEKSEKKKSSQPELILTRDQIIDIAKRLGIEIVMENKDDKEEINES